ncbi:xylulokinase [Salirhabdus salicampi]|uniref:xylulokinase n=1 Tax=Salirhabdus salicampi TaxID=476102 RepID=UPI0020C1D2D6|nr:FGGY family carbohydrate kinase [Salirhabdus salicampi]MCP8617699.1 FGGY family carbohydrate kinase [Salirhabdus salicampi]
MGYIAVFDIGTTAIKGVLVSREGSIKGELSVDLTTHYGSNREIEQVPLDWWHSVTNIANKWWNEFHIKPEDISMITFSGQMEDVIPISTNGTSVNAILYSDQRAIIEAQMIKELYPTIHKTTRNGIHPSTPIAKLLWLERYDQSIYEETKCFVFSAKDFIIYQLTNKCVTDSVTGATTGMMNLKTRSWDENILDTIGIDNSKLPLLLEPSNIVGNVSERASKEIGFLPSTPVLAGSGDAGASTLGAATIDDGDGYFYIGTTGWTAIVQHEEKMDDGLQGIFRLAHLPKDRIIAIAPLLNVGNVHKWAMNTFFDSQTRDDYENFEHLVEESPPGSNGVLFLPYLNGERFPVHDSEAKGAFWGIGPQTSKGDMVRSVIEGICFSLKQLFESFDVDDHRNVTLIGGGTKSSVWCQILADCLGRELRVPTDSQYMTAIGASATAFVQLGWTKDYNEFSKRYLMSIKCKTYIPRQEHYDMYQQHYRKFIKLYPSLVGLYRDE